MGDSGKDFFSLIKGWELPLPRLGCMKIKNLEL